MLSTVNQKGTALISRDSARMRVILTYTSEPVEIQDKAQAYEAD
jgi:hypothetical protein